MKNIRIFYLKNRLFLVVKFSVYLNRRVFVMFSLGSMNPLWYLGKLSASWGICSPVKYTVGSWLIKQSLVFIFYVCVFCFQGHPLYISFDHALQQCFVCLFVLRFYGPVNPMGSC